MKRIDFVGNANSYPLIVAKGMRSLGYEVHMHLLCDQYLDEPANLYPEFRNRYPDWIHDWRPCNIPYEWDAERLDEVYAEIKKSDALVLNLGAVCLGYGQQKPYFCLLTGTDLLTYCGEKFFLCDKILRGRKLSCSPEEYLKAVCISNYSDLQRAAIKRANGYYFFPRGILPEADRLLREIGAETNRQVSFLATDTARLKFSEPVRSEHLRVIVGARCTWDKSILPPQTEQDYKGTDVFLRGAAMAINNGVPLLISMFRKGKHVPQTERLIQDLGITDFCVWHDECAQYEFLDRIRRHDVVVDSLDTAHVGMVCVDSFSLGRPVIARSPSRELWRLPDPFPICNALTAEDVAEELGKLASDQTYYIQMAKAGRQFAEKYLKPEYAAQKIIKALQTPSIPRVPDSGEDMKFYLFRLYTRMQKTIAAMEKNSQENTK